MIANDLNLNLFRIFQAVFESRSMTEAAKVLHLTQSGVSQHIGALEEALGLKLFDRVKQRLIPTRAAEALAKGCSESFERISQVLDDLRVGPKELRGEVRVGVPIEFGNSVIVPMLSQFGRAHPKVKFSLRYGFATEMNERLLSGELDFAFVDDFVMDPRIHKEVVFQEELLLCGSVEYLKEVGVGSLKSSSARDPRQQVERLDFVDYQAGEPVLMRWLNHHFPRVRAWDLRVRAHAMDVLGVARMIENRLGCGVLPSYLVRKLREGGTIKVIEGPKDVLKNPISIASIQGRTVSPAAAKLREKLLLGI